MPESVVERAKGKWRGVLIELGVPSKYLDGKHHPCPMCGGKDRFRFDDKDGTGSYICGQCGAGRGFRFLQEFHGWGKAETFQEIEAVVGSVKAEPIRRGRTHEQNVRENKALWEASVPVETGSPVDLYLKKRGIDLNGMFPPCIRYHSGLIYYGSGPSHVRYPGMVTAVQAPDGKVTTLHRTYLTQTGDKADVEKVRRVMPGQIADGAAIRLGKVGEDGVLGVAEGIETALAASILFDVCVWSVINTSMMLKFQPPNGVGRLIVFADNDPKFGGQKAAYTVAHTQAVKSKFKVEVRVPESVGTDWNDVLMQR